MKHFEEFDIGERADLGSHSFTAEEIVEFARKWDPQRFHIDEDAARESLFGGLCASGWHTACVWMRLNVAFVKREMKRRAGAGLPVVPLGPSPGFRNLSWKRPVFAGDTVSFLTEVTGLRDADRRPGWGLVDIRNTGMNQHGELAFAFDGSVFAKRQAQSHPG